MKTFSKLTAYMLTLAMAASMVPANCVMAAETEEAEAQYVLMNIPYAEFYEADVNNDVPVDAFTSATMSKTKTWSLSGGSYHVNSDGSDITGITFPVKVGEGVDLSQYVQVTDEDTMSWETTNRGTTSTTTLTGSQCLYENASYAYYVLSETPAYYKDVTLNADGSLEFGAVQGEVQTIEGSVELQTSTSYGDYQMEVNGITDYVTANQDDVYAVIVSTREGNDYGMRHLENIWRVSELAWCTGYTTSVHGCPTSSAHYEAMMGQTIESVTYYTSNGAYKIEGLDEYVAPISGATVTVADAMVYDGQTTVTVENLPEDFDAEYTVDGLADAAYADGVITYSKDVSNGQYTLMVTDQSGKYASVKASFTLKAYVLMNIPYAAFYKAEVNNDVDVDVFTSATLAKTKTTSLSGGTYHTTDGSEITGITYPVLVGNVNLGSYTQVTDDETITYEVTNRGQTSTVTLTGKDCLAEKESYAYYILSEDEVPSYYKEMTSMRGSVSFGAVQGDVIEVAGSAELTTESTYGDYQMTVSGLTTETDREGNVTVEGVLTAGEDDVYAVVVSTAEGNDYGMRHLENIWRVSELAWCTGFTTAVHGCPTSSTHYVAMMGQTIESVTYYTEKGIYKVTGLNVYVPVKFAYTLAVADGTDGTGSVALTAEGMPEDYEAVYTVDGLDVTVADGMLSYTDAAKGAYTLTVSDASGKYASLKASFELKTDKVVAAQSGDALVAAEGASEEEFAEYIAAISAVEVNGTSYSASGRMATTIVKEDGTIDTELSIFADPAVYTLVVKATGYQDVTVTMDRRAEQTVTVTSKYTKTYGNKAFTVKASTDGDGALSFKSSNKSVAAVSSAGKVTIKGAGTAKITVTAAATETCKSAKKTITITVKKAAQPMTVKAASSTVSLAKVTKAKQTVKLTVKKAQGKVTYKSSSKNVTVSSKGVVTFKKGTKKGSYKITVKAAGNDNYKSGSKTITIKVK